MYTIDVNKTNKLVSVSISGILLENELLALFNELSEKARLFEEKEAAYLFLVERLDPVSQEYLHYLLKTYKMVLTMARKVAAVHKRTVTKMQGRRLEGLVNQEYCSAVKMMRFKTKREAMKYLLDR